MGFEASHAAGVGAFLVQLQHQQRSLAHDLFGEAEQEVVRTAVEVGEVDDVEQLALGGLFQGGEDLLALAPKGVALADAEAMQLGLHEIHGQSRAAHVGDLLGQARVGAPVVLVARDFCGNGRFGSTVESFSNLRGCQNHLPIGGGPILRSISSASLLVTALAVVDPPIVVPNVDRVAAVDVGVAHIASDSAVVRHPGRMLPAYASRRHHRAIVTGSNARPVLHRLEPRPTVAHG
jgi:hypothetical protein